MSWFDIIKYNRDHYVEANKKHSDKGTINRHKKILDLVSNSSIKNKNMGRTINSIKNNQPVIIGFPPIQEIINLSIEEVIDHLYSLMGQVDELFRNKDKRTFERFNNNFEFVMDELQDLTRMRDSNMVRQILTNLLKPIYKLIRDTNTRSRRRGRF